MRYIISLFLLVATPAVFSQEKEVITVYFSPEEQVAEKLISLIDQEKESIRAAVYCLMHHGIARALIRAHERGVDVEVLVDSFSIKSRSPIKKMVAANIPVYVWNPPPSKYKKRGSLMHDKFCVLGHEKVWTGSFNFTREAAVNNRENVVLLQDPSIANRYLEEFNHLKEISSVPYQTYTEMNK